MFNHDLYWQCERDQRRLISGAIGRGEEVVRKFMIEREIAGVGGFDLCQLGEAAATSNKALAELAPRVQWQHSYVTGNRTYCVYLADDEEAIHAHATLSGFPANRISEITSVIDPTTANVRER